MNVSRESISVALFNLISTNASLDALVNSFTRVPRMWTDVGDAEKPQVLLFKGGPATEEYEQPQNQRIGLTKNTVAYNLWLYVTSPYPPVEDVVIETLLNNIADGFDQAMQSRINPDGTIVINGLRGERQTLGGLVNNAWIDGGSEWSREFQDGNIVCQWRIFVQTGI